MNINKSAMVRLESVAHSHVKCLSRKDSNLSEVRFTSLGINLSVEKWEIPNPNYPVRIFKIKC